MSNRAEVIKPAAGTLSESRKRLLTGAGQARFNDYMIGAILPAAVLLIWQLAGDLHLISTFFLPTPLIIAGAFKELLVSGELFRHLGISLQRAAAGFALGGSFGLVLGVLVGMYRSLEKVLDPSIQLLRLVPHLAVAPLIILWFGFGETSKIAIIAIGSFFPLYINTFLGIRSVDKKLFEVSDVLAFSRWKQAVRLILPAALPQTLLGVRLSLAISWLGLVVAELIGSRSGVGFLINAAKQESVTEDIFVGVIIFAVVGKLVDSLVRLLEKKLLKWRESYQG